MSCTLVLFLFLFAQLVEHCANNAKVVGLIPRENKNMYTSKALLMCVKIFFSLKFDVFVSISPLDTSISSKNTPTSIKCAQAAVSCHVL